MFPSEIESSAEGNFTAVFDALHSEPPHGSTRPRLQREIELGKWGPFLRQGTQDASPELVMSFALSRGYVQQRTQGSNDPGLDQGEQIVFKSKVQSGWQLF